MANNNGGKLNLINGILLLYHHVLIPNALTIMDHVNSFECYSKFKVWKVNTELGLPDCLKNMRFRIIVFHYSLFGMWPCMLNADFLSYLDECSPSYKVAFFQDEYHFCKQRFTFLNRYKIDCIYTLLEPQYFKDVYQKHTTVVKLIHTPFTGLVGDEMVKISKKITKADAARKIDIGYRARKLPFYMGKGAREKYDVAVGFCKRVKGLGLKIDVETDEDKRIYGIAWYKFLANCRATLGAESGVSIFDINDTVYAEYKRMIEENPRITFEEMWEKFLYKWEGNIPNRVFSPRHFEAATFRVCQILFEDKYAGVMRPMEHYIPMKKDFSNFDEVIRLFKNKKFRCQIAENAYSDLVASGRYSYRSFIENFDSELLKSGFVPEKTAQTYSITTLLEKEKAFLYKKAVSKMMIRAPLRFPFPGRQAVKSVIKRTLRRYRCTPTGQYIEKKIKIAHHRIRSNNKDLVLKLREICKRS